jgi:hypothetical protein
MALPHAFDKILERVLRLTGDSKYTRWSKDELIDYINEGQREFCEKTMILRAEAPLTVRENSEIYTLPDDCFIVDRMERNDGYLIPKTTSRDLARSRGRNYRSDFGRPQVYYQDLDGMRQLRFYPIPDDSITSTYRSFEGELGVVTQAGEYTIEPLIVDNVEIVDVDGPLFLQDLESLPFTSELGLTVDDTSLDEFGRDTNTFNLEEGEVVQVLNTEGAFRVWYVRYPREDILEIDDLQAMQYYTLHKCYEKDGPIQNIELSNLYEQRYQERVNREIGRVSSGQHANMSTRGTYA